MILSFGYLILRQLLQLVILVLRGDRANACVPRNSGAIENENRS